MLNLMLNFLILILLENVIHCIIASTIQSITLYDEPIIWIDEYQIFSDTISINYFDKKINKLFLISNPLIISKNDSLEYNQIKGKK